MTVHFRRKRMLALAALSAFTVTTVNQAAAPGDPLSSDIVVNTTTPDTQQNAAVARSANGAFVVVWEGSGAGDPDGVFLRRYDLFGAPVGTEIRVNTVTSGIQRNPSVSMGAGGKFVVAWESENVDGSGFGIVAQRFGDGGASGDPIAVNTYTTGDQAAPTVAISATGAFVVAWQSGGQDGSGQGVYAQRFDAAGAAVGPEFQANTVTTADQAAPSAAIDAAGNFAIAWQSENQEGDGLGNGIYAQRFDAGGVPAGGEFHVDTTPDGEQTAPSIALDAAGDLLAAWQGSDADGSGIYLQRFDAAGTPVGVETPVNLSTVGDQVLPAVAMDAEGAAIVAWQGPDAADTGIYSQRFDADGAVVGTETPVNSEVADAQLRPAVAVDADGDAVVAWESEGEDGDSGLGIVARRFVGTEDVDLSIAKTDTVDPVVSGTGELSYTITVTNNHVVSHATGVPSIDGAIGAATGLIVTDTLPAGVEGAVATGEDWTCGAPPAFVATEIITCNRANPLGAGESSDITVTAPAPATTGEITNLASVAADSPDAETGNNTAQQATALCAEGDDAGTVQFTASAVVVSESDDHATVDVSRTGGTCASVSVHYIAVDGTAHAGTDYQATSGTLTFAAGDTTTQTITVPIHDDSLHEALEFFTVKLRNPDRAQVGADQVAVVITDDDAAPVVNFSPATATVTEGSGGAATPVTVTAQLSAVSGADVTVAFTVGGTATGGQDHDAVAGTITIPAGDASGTTTFDVLDDTIDEADETVVLTMGAVTGATAGPDNVHTTTIVDDDAAPTVAFSATSTEADESAGTVNLTVQLTGLSDQPIDVAFSTSGTATSGDAGDYAISSSPVTIPAGFGSATITLTLDDDALDEPNETVIVTLDSATHATLGANTQHTVTIVDNDAAPTVTLARTASPIFEGTVNNVSQVRARLSAPSAQPVTVDLGFGGSAEPTDYSRSASSIVIAPGALVGAVTLTALDDALDENDETILVDIVAVTNGTESGDQVVRIVIADDDAPPTVSWTPATVDVSEGGTAGRNVLATLTLSAPSGQRVTVPYTVGGTATAGTDHTAIDGEAIFNPGQTSQRVAFRVLPDRIHEPNETVVLSLGTPIRATVAEGTFTANILDDDPAPTVTLSSSAASFGENGGTATLTATLGSASTDDVTVNLGFAGNASSPGDYTRSAASIVIPAGQTSGGVTLTGVDDALHENDETVIVEVTSVVNATERGVQRQVLTIVDDDAAPTVGFDPASVSVTEGNQGAKPVDVTLKLSAPSALAVTVSYGVGGTATPGSDHTAAAGSVTFAPGVTSRTFRYSVLGDKVPEPTETVVLTLGTVSNATIGAGTHTTTIVDND